MDIEKLQKRLASDAADWAGDGYIKRDLHEAADALEKLQAELNAAKSPEVLKAVDELMEFARVRMSTADWLYYVDALGGWRGQKEE